MIRTSLSRVETTEDDEYDPRYYQKSHCGQYSSASYFGGGLVRFSGPLSDIFVHGGELGGHH
jgi:hypothetical protein